MSILDDAAQRRQKRAGGALTPEAQGKLQARAMVLEVLLEADLDADARHRVMAALRERGVLD